MGSALERGGVPAADPTPRQRLPEGDRGHTACRGTGEVPCGPHRGSTTLGCSGEGVALSWGSLALPPSGDSAPTAVASARELGQHGHPLGLTDKVGTSTDHWRPRPGQALCRSYSRNKFLLHLFFSTVSSLEEAHHSTSVSSQSVCCSRSLKGLLVCRMSPVTGQGSSDGKAKLVGFVTQLRVDGVIQPQDLVQCQKHVHLLKWLLLCTNRSLSCSPVLPPTLARGRLLDVQCLLSWGFPHFCVSPRCY